MKHQDTALLAEALRGAVGRFVRTVRSESATTTTAQGEVLAQLQLDGPATVTALAAQRGVRHQSMRLIVARLVEQGVVALRPNPDDARSQLVALTRRGVNHVKAQQAARADYLASQLATRLTGAERAILAQAVNLLDRLGSSD